MIVAPQSLANEPGEAPAARLCGMKTVGTQTRSEIEVDPSKAWQRGAALDAMLHAAKPARRHGVWRLTHLQMNRLDLERQREQAARVNGLGK